MTRRVDTAKPGPESIETKLPLEMTTSGTPSRAELLRDEAAAAALRGAASAAGAIARAEAREVY